MTPNDIENVVAGSEQPVEEQQPGDVSGVAQPTPTEEQPVDAVSQYEQDIRALKSLADRRLNEQQQREEQWRAAYEQLQNEILERDKRLYQFETAGMSQEQKQEYDLRRELGERDKKLQDLEQRFNALQMQQVAAQRQTAAIQYYTQRYGMNPEILSQYAESPQMLDDFVTEAIRRRLELSTAPPPQAPKVATSTGAPPKSGVLSKMDSMSQQEIDEEIARAKRGELNINDL